MLGITTKNLYKDVFYEIIETLTPEDIVKNHIFINHILNHLKFEDYKNSKLNPKITKNKVGCKICGLDIDQIFETEFLTNIRDLHINFQYLNTYKGDKHYKENLERVSE